MSRWQQAKAEEFFQALELHVRNRGTPIEQRRQRPQRLRGNWRQVWPPPQKGWKRNDN